MCRVLVIARSGVAPGPRGELGWEGRPSGEVWSPAGLACGTVVWLSFENSTVCRCLVCLSSSASLPGFRVCGVVGVSLSAPGFVCQWGSGVFAGTVLFQCFLLESLILAQDERWRRA